MTESTKIDIRAETVRRLLRQASTVSLATTMVADATPYASLVLMATDPAGHPLLLLSDLAVHSQNIARDAHASLLIAEEPGEQDPLTLPRISVEGVFEIVEDTNLKARYLRRFPSANDFVDFPDFRLYRMKVSRAHLVAGFGDIHWLDGKQFLIDPGFLASGEAEIDIIDHMNTDHADAVQELALMKTGNPVDGWEICGIDVEGMDLRRGWQYERILFSAHAAGAEDVRKRIIERLNDARS
jgi:hypothetical protein